MVKNLPAIQETHVQFLVRELDPYRLQVRVHKLVVIAAQSCLTLQPHGL